MRVNYRRRLEMRVSDMKDPPGVLVRAKRVMGD